MPASLRGGDPEATLDGLRVGDRGVLVSGQGSMFDGMYELIEWAFQVVLDDRDRATLTREIMSGWGDDDPSEQELVLGLMQGWAQLRTLPAGMLEARRPPVLVELYSAMGQARPDDCGRVLFRLQEVLSVKGVGVPDAAADRRQYDAGYQARVDAAMAASRAAHQTQMDAIMRIGGWERVYR